MTGTLIVTALLMAAATASVRLLPFLFGHRLGGGRLRQVYAQLFPPAVLAVLVVHFGSAVASAPTTSQIAQAVGAAVTVAVHWWGRRLLLSVASGTAACMLVLRLAAG